MKMIFKTTNRYGKYMVPRVMLFGSIGVVGTVTLSIGLDKHRGEIVPFIVTIIFGLSTCYMIVKMMPRWFLYMYTVELYEDRLVGYNLFGKKQEFEFKIIKKIGKAKGIYVFGLDKEIIDINSNIYRVNGDMDYAGFIYDYIIEKCRDRADIDYDFIKKITEVPSRWLYTRRMPFDTKYEDGYLEWIESIVNAQKEMLIQRGSLKPGVLYGDNVKDLLWVKKER